MFDVDKIMTMQQANRGSIQGASLNDFQFILPDEEIQHHNDVAEQEYSPVVEEREDLALNVEPLKIDPYVTSYVCLLIPRFEEYLMVGDLSEWLPVWMKEICISFGWQLQFLDVSPKYLHWVMSVSITTYPAQFMKIVRKESSLKIFDDFPRMKRTNMSTDFWAPWYSVQVGQAPYSQSVIQTFLKQIRTLQGL